MDLRSIFAGITGARREAGADVPGQTALALRVRTAVERLPTDQRLLLTLADLEGCPLAEVAGILELPIGTVASRLGRARAAMRAMLADLPAAAEGPVAAGRPPTDEHLGALVDGELPPADAQALLEQLCAEPALRERLGELELGKALLRHAYALAPAPALAAAASAARATRWCSACSKVGPSCPMEPS